MTSLTIVRELPEQTWRCFVARHPLSTVFHTPEMFRVFDRTKGYTPELWAAVDNHGQPLVLMLPVQITLLPGPWRRLTTRTIVYGSLLCAPDTNVTRVLTPLLRAYSAHAKSRALFTELRHASNVGEWQSVLCASGYIFEAHFNYLINLARSPADMLQSIGPRTRKRIRRGLRRGTVQVSEIDTPNAFDQWYRTLRKTYHHAQVPLADRSLFAAAFTELVPKGMAKFLLASVDSRPAACTLELLHKHTIYGWYNGVDRGYSKVFPNEMLTWHILCWGREHDYRIYDFGGAGKPDESYGVRDFKAKFGGRLVRYGRNTCVHTPRLLAVCRRSYSLYRRVLC